ncbi:MAG: cupredoxin domain-containing protein [Patescibacteria group bacterium]
MQATTISIIIAGLLIGGVILFTGPEEKSKNQKADNVSIVDGKQIVEINAKGGYEPKISTAKANIPTILRVKTQGTFDCSSSLTIPSMGYRTNLPPSGITDVEIPIHKSGEKLQILCSMGMYNSQIIFN